MSRDLDLVLHGATGFAGRLTAEHLARHAPPGLRIGLSGRTLSRLSAVRAALGPAAAGWELIVADAADATSLATLAARTTAIASTVGPYAKHGLPLVQACAAAGTHYADLTGEVTFVRRSIDTCHATAVATGARIVHACGFDSVPSDLAVLLLAERAKADGAGELGETTYALVGARGGVSGGTIDSMRGLMVEARADGATRRLLADPYSLSPDRAGEPSPGDGADGFLPGRDPDVGWTAPFVMASYNTRIVRRSNALTGWAYGRGFRYREVVKAGPTPIGPLVGAGMTLGLGLFAGAMSLAPTRALLDRVLPKPGAGPSKQAQDSGFFKVRVHTRTTTGAHYVAQFDAKGDPGYKATAVMLGECALALATGEGLPEYAGVLTPATGIGSGLAERLRPHGFTIDVQRA